MNPPAWIIRKVETNEAVGAVITDRPRVSRRHSRGPNKPLLIHRVNIVDHRNDVTSPLRCQDARELSGMFLYTNRGIDPAPAPAASVGGSAPLIKRWSRLLPEAEISNSPPLPRGATSRLATRLAQKASEAGFTSPMLMLASRQRLKYVKSPFNWS